MIQQKLFDLIPQALPEPKEQDNEKVRLLIADMKRICDEAKRKYGAGTLYEYQKRNKKQ